MEIHNRWRFADVVIDLNELVALVGEKVYLRDGREMGVGVAAADALRKAIPSYPEPPQGTRDKEKDSRLSRSPVPSPSRTDQARASKAQARLPRHSS